MIHANDLDTAIKAIFAKNAMGLLAHPHRNAYNAYMGQCLRLKTVRVRLMDMLGVHWDEISTSRIKSSIGRIGKTATRTYSFRTIGTGSPRRIGLYFEGTASGELLNNFDTYRQENI